MIEYPEITFPEIEKAFYKIKRQNILEFLEKNTDNYSISKTEYIENKAYCYKYIKCIESFLGEIRSITISFFNGIRHSGYSTDIINYRPAKSVNSFTIKEDKHQDAIQFDKELEEVEFFCNELKFLMEVYKEKLSVKKQDVK